MKNAEFQCSFCVPEVESIQEVTRNNTIRVIYPRKPIISQYVMFVPVRHIESISDLSAAESSDLVQAYAAIKKAIFDLDGMTGANLFANDGREAGQHVPHVHFHMFGRATSETVSPYKILNNMGQYSIERLDDVELRSRADRMKAAVAKYW